MVWLILALGCIHHEQPVAHVLGELQTAKGKEHATILLSTPPRAAHDQNAGMRPRSVMPTYTYMAQTNTHRPMMNKKKS